jgi:tetratricopeptide (TPR) repeat protein
VPPTSPAPSFICCEAHEQRGRLLLGLVARLPLDARKKPRALTQGELEKAVAAGGEGAALYEDLGTVLDQQAQYKNAVEFFSKALDLPVESGRARLLNKRGWAYVNLSQHPQARADLEPADRNARLLRAEAHTGLGYLDACAKVYAGAQEHATRALDWLRQPLDHYVLRHNLACIYAEMSRWDVSRRAEYQDLALTFLGEAVELARNRGTLANEKQLIEQESAFPPSLRERPDFKKLLHEAGS